MAQLKERSFNAFLSSAPLLPELIEHIDVGTKWYLLGTLLHVDDKRLDGIEQLQGHDDTRKTLKMFQHWLTTTSTASRRQVLETLRKGVVNEHTVADKYEKYLRDLHDTTYTPPSTEAVSILQRNIQSLNEALVSPVQVSQLLYCKRCISDTTLDEMEKIDESRSLDDKKTTLLTAMQETVFSDYRKLKDIATVLSDVEETRDIANKMLTEYEKIPDEDDQLPQQEAVDNHASDILRKYYSALSQSITEPVYMARLLHDEVLSDEALSCVISARSPSVFDSRAVLLKAIRNAVHSNCKLLEKVIDVLMKFSETVHIGYALFKEYNEAKSTGHTFLITRNMGTNFEDMRMDLGEMFNDVRGIFSNKKEQLDVKQVKGFINDCCNNLKPKINCSETIDEVLDVVKENCSIVDVRLLKRIAEKFKIPEAEKIIKLYQEKAATFCESVSVRLCLGEKLHAVAVPSTPKREKVTFIFNWDPDESTLQDVRAVLDKLEPLDIFLIKLEIGQSVVVTCYCPAEYISLLIATVHKKLVILQKRGLKEFRIAQCTIWVDTTLEVTMDAIEVSEKNKLITKLMEKEPQPNEELQSMKGTIAAEEIEKTMLPQEVSKRDVATQEDLVSMKDSITAKEIEKPKAKVVERDITIAELKKENEQLKKELQSMKDTTTAENFQLIKDTNTAVVEPELTKEDEEGTSTTVETWRHVKYVPRDVLIIGSFGNYNDWPQKQNVVSPRKHSISAEQWMLETAGIIKKHYLKNTKDYQLHETPGGEQTKAYYMEYISKIFINCKKGGVIIYYTGHSEKNTGNWCFKDGVISLNDIFNLFEKHLQERGLSLTIVSDCSYSGNWINDCADHLDKMEIPSCGHYTREKNILVQVVASCQHNEEVTASYANEAVEYLEEFQVVKFRDNILSSGQKPVGVDFRTIRCGKNDNEPCEADNVCTWKDCITHHYSEVVPFYVSFEGKGYWHFAALETEDEKENFRREVASGKIDRKIMRSHESDELPKDIDRKILLQKGNLLKPGPMSKLL